MYRSPFLYGVQDIYLTTTSKLLDQLREVEVKKLEQEICKELGENPFLPDLSMDELEELIDSKLCARLVFTSNQIDTLKEDNQKDASYLSKLSQLCLDKIFAYIWDDTNRSIELCDDLFRQLKKIRIETKT